MQNLTLNNLNIAIDETATNASAGSSNNFASKVSSSKDGGDFGKIFEDTTRRQKSKTPAKSVVATDSTNTDSAKVANVKTEGTKTETAKTEAPKTEVSQTEAPEDVTLKAQVQITDETSVVVEDVAQEVPEVMVAEAPEADLEIKSEQQDEEADKAKIQEVAAVLDKIIQFANNVLNVAEVAINPELIDKINNLLNEVKSSDILTTENLQKIQADFEVIVNDVKNLVAPETEVTTVAPSLDLEVSKNVVIDTLGDKAVQAPVESEKQGQVKTQTPTDTQAQPQEQPESQVQTQSQVQNSKNVQLPKEAVVKDTTQALFVSEEDIDVIGGSIEDLEVGQDVKDEPVKTTVDTQQTIDKNIVNELNASVEAVVATAPQPQKGHGNILKSALSASEQIIKLSIEQAAPKVDTEANPNDLFRGKQDSTQNFNLNFGANLNQTQSVISGKINFDDALKSDILNQVGTQIEQMKEGPVNGKITLALRPIELGRVVIELTQNANGVTTNIIAQNSNVKELLEKNIESLKQQLAQAGVNVQNINVKTADNKENSEQSDGQGQGEQKEQSREEKGQNKDSSKQKNNDKKEQE